MTKREDGSRAIEQAFSGESYIERGKKRLSKCHEPGVFMAIYDSCTQARRKNTIRDPYLAMKKAGVKLNNLHTCYLL